MTWISSVVTKYRRNINVFLALSICTILILDFFGINQYVSQGGLASFHAPFSKIKHTIEELSDVAIHNVELRQSLVEASLRLEELEEMKRENIRLRSVLGFDPPPGYSLLPARMMSITGEKNGISAVVNRGTNDSVAINQSVINQRGLIGRVMSVTSDYATIQLLTDPKNRVAVRVASSREMGIVRYSLSSGLIVENFQVQGRIVVGDLLLSSGLGGIYPGGLAVGTVTSVERPKEEPFCNIKLLPAADFSSLEELFILRPNNL